jgi:hypothetical protein
MAAMPARLVGNRLALFGAVLYFGEWIGIVIAPSLPTDKLGVGSASIVAAYTQSPSRTAFLAGWLSVVILGRIAFCVGLRDAFRLCPRSLRLADFAVGAMVVSVSIEVISYGFVATGAWLAKAGAAPSSIVAFDTAGATFFYLIIAPVGVAVFAGSLAMLLSSLFARWLAWLGVVAGALLAAGGIESSAAAGSSGGLHDLGLMPIPLFWIWIIVTGITLFRATPRRERATA